jgi:NAD(P)H-dependent FMN reductase
MPHVAILSAFTQVERTNYRVVLYFKKFLEEYNLASSEIIDLNNYHLPFFCEEINGRPDPIKLIDDFTGKIKSASGILIVTPEIEGSYPQHLKNIVDLTHDSWFRKPIAISNVSSDVQYTRQALATLQYTLWKIKAWTIPVRFPVASAEKEFDEQGVPFNKIHTDNKARLFVNELLWYMKVKKQIIPERPDESEAVPHEDDAN